MSSDPRLAIAIAAAEEQASNLRAEMASRRAEIPLRLWRQTAHFTTPADEGMARKAVEGGTSATVRILERLGVTPRDLADRLSVDVRAVEGLLERPRRAPLVMLDGEDAQALRDDVAAVGIRAAVNVIRDADWDGDGPRTLRFYRPPGFGIPAAMHDLLTVLWGVAREGADRFPLDGIVFPKVEHPEEVDLLYRTLSDAERALGLADGTVRVAFLIESGWSAARLPEIARHAASRLCGLIFGLADYSADLGLRAIANDHALADWVRAEIVNTAGAVGVPAIDGMTLDYPVTDPALSRVANSRRFLDRMALAYADAVRARDMGMHGKWVGHPAQLFAVLLAFETAEVDATLETEAEKLEAYRHAVEVEARGATIIGGVMSDRATDRHARVVLRRAVALGHFDPDRAFSLGVISGAEVTEARGWRLGGSA